MTITDTAAGRYRISEIAELSGFNPSTLRYYEQAGVLAAPDRTPAGYRVYGARDVERLRLIARAKNLGCTLDEIAELVRAWDEDECDPVKHRLRTLVHDKVAEVEARLAEQATFADQLRATATALAGRPLDGPCDDTCGCTDTADVTEPTGEGSSSGCGCGDGDRGVALGRRTDATDPVPIACSLPGTDMAARIDDWNRVLSHVTRRLPLPGGTRLELSDCTELPIVAALVQAEQSCCPFFSFAITVDQRGLALEVTAPSDGQDLLATVFGDDACRPHRPASGRDRRAPHRSSPPAAPLDRGGRVR